MDTATTETTAPLRSRKPGLAGVVLLAALLAVAGWWLLSQGETPTKITLPNQPAAKDGNAFTFVSTATVSRVRPIGIVLSTQFGLPAQALEALPAQFSREFFYDWLRPVDKLLETTSRLRVPRLRSDRPVLDGRDIYEGFFAPKPWLWDITAPLEGSLSVLGKQGFHFTPPEREALDAMLKASMGKQEAGRQVWHAFPVGSKITLRAGSQPSVEIWINRGPQHESIDDTVRDARCELISTVPITDPLQKTALNKHFNYALEAKDEVLEHSSQGKYHTPREKLYDLVRELRAQPRATPPAAPARKE